MYKFIYKQLLMYQLIRSNEEVRSRKVRVQLSEKRLNR